MRRERLGNAVSVWVTVSVWVSEARQFLSAVLRSLRAGAGLVVGRAKETAEGVPEPDTLDLPPD